MISVCVPGGENVNGNSKQSKNIHMLNSNVQRQIYILKYGHFSKVSKVSNNILYFQLCNHSINTTKLNIILQTNYNKKKSKPILKQWRLKKLRSQNNNVDSNYQKNIILKIMKD